MRINLFDLCLEKYSYCIDILAIETSFYSGSLFYISFRKHISKWSFEWDVLWLGIYKEYCFENAKRIFKNMERFMDIITFKFVRIIVTWVVIITLTMFLIYIGEVNFILYWLVFMVGLKNLKDDLMEYMQELLIKAGKG